MVINDLVRAYDRLIKDPNCEINQDGFCFGLIENLVVIDDEGILKEIVTVSQPMRERLPENLCPGGVKKNILYDSFEFFFGLKSVKDKLEVAVDGKSKQKDSKFECFKNANLQLLEDVESFTAKAIVKFLNSWNPQENLHNPLFFVKKDDGSSSVKSFKGNFAFCLNSIVNKCYNDHAILNKVTESITQRNSQAEPDGICCITGEFSKIAQKHKSFSGSQNYLISVDNGTKSFHSYGKTWCFDSPVSEEVMNKYTAVLNYFYRSGSKNKLSWGDDVLMFWADCPSGLYEEEALELFGAIDTSQEEESKINLSLNLLKQGIHVQNDVFETPNDTEMYFLLLSKNSARFSVRKYYRTRFGNFKQSVLQHYLDMQLIGSEKPVPLWQIVNATVSSNSSDKPNPSFCGAFADAILNCQKNYPHAMFAEMLSRLKTDNAYAKLSDKRFAFVKAYLTRKNRLSNNNTMEEITMALNTENTNQAYLLGRLFAVMEKTQQDAISGINTTIKDKFFASACCTPATIFPTLLMGYQNNVAKLNKGGVRYEKIVNEIFEKLSGEALAKQLPLEEQGLFFIGYYHQRNSLWTKQEKEEAVE